MSERIVLERDEFEAHLLARRRRAAVALMRARRLYKKRFEAKHNAALNAYRSGDRQQAFEAMARIRPSMDRWQRLMDDLLDVALPQRLTADNMDALLDQKDREFQEWKKARRGKWTFSVQWRPMAIYALMLRSYRAWADRNGDE